MEKSVYSDNESTTMGYSNIHNSDLNNKSDYVRAYAYSKAKISNN